MRFEFCAVSLAVNSLMMSAGELDVCAAYVGPAARAFRDALRARCTALLSAPERPRRFVALTEIPHRRDGSPHRAAVRARLTDASADHAGAKK